jgi:hypothetical protein
MKIKSILITLLITLGFANLTISQVTQHFIGTLSKINLSPSSSCTNMYGSNGDTNFYHYRSTICEYEGAPYPCGTTSNGLGYSGGTAWYLDTNIIRNTMEFNHTIFQSGLPPRFTLPGEWGNSLSPGIYKLRYAAFWPTNVTNPCVSNYYILSSPLLLVVTGIIKSPSDAKVLAGKSAIFDISDIGYSGTPATYQWQLNDGSGFLI